MNNKERAEQIRILSEKIFSVMDSVFNKLGIELSDENNYDIQKVIMLCNERDRI